MHNLSATDVRLRMKDASCHTSLPGTTFLTLLLTHHWEKYILSAKDTLDPSIVLKWQQLNDNTHN